MLTKTANELIGKWAQIRRGDYKGYGGTIDAITLREDAATVRLLVSPPVSSLLVSIDDLQYCTCGPDGACSMCDRSVPTDLNPPAERQCNHPGAHTSWCNYGKPSLSLETASRRLTLEQANSIEAEMRAMEADTSTDLHAMRLFMQDPMPCGHATGNLLTCFSPPFGCVICGPPPDTAAAQPATGEEPRRADVECNHCFCWPNPTCNCRRPCKACVASAAPPVPVVAECKLPAPVAQEDLNPPEMTPESLTIQRLTACLNDALSYLELVDTVKVASRGLYKEAEVVGKARVIIDEVRKQEIGAPHDGSDCQSSCPLHIDAGDHVLAIMEGLASPVHGEEPNL